MAIKRFLTPSEAERVYEVVEYGKARESNPVKISAEEALQLFRELRQEVTVLAVLDSPYVVNLRGVCLNPLFMATELAPEGSLFTVLTKKREDIIAQQGQRTVSQIPKMPGGVLGHEWTTELAVQVRSCVHACARACVCACVHVQNCVPVHMCMVCDRLGECNVCVCVCLCTFRQVAMALSYLHDQHIVYRDLKADNVLVWKLDKTQPVNIKLADYGISRFANPGGVKGDQGTPGYMAPEALKKRGEDQAFDEKVMWSVFGKKVQNLCAFAMLCAYSIYKRTYVQYVCGV